jgi:hypothetical protein
MFILSFLVCEIIRIAGLFCGNGDSMSTLHTVPGSAATGWSVYLNADAVIKRHSDIFHDEIVCALLKAISKS